jgi:Domain of unknown function (DUF4440)
MTTDQGPSKEDIIALETAYWEAMRAKDGSETSRLSGDISLVTGAKGVMTIAKSKMGQMTEEGTWTLDSYAFEDVEVVIPTPHVAIIAYTVTQKVTMDGKSEDFRAADSSTWIKGADGWECHAHSETFLQD